MAPGEELAVFEAAATEPGPPDIYGHTRPPPGVEALLRAGDNAELVGDRYVARVYGYACLTAGELSVIPPLWVSPDVMEAYHVQLPGVGPAPRLSREGLLQACGARRVLYGLQETAIDALLAEPPTAGAPRATLVAQGSRPRRGDDAGVRLAFGPRDGRLPADLAARHEASLVRAGDLLCEVESATQGRPRRRPDGAHGRRGGRPGDGPVRRAQCALRGGRVDPAVLRPGRRLRPPAREDDPGLPRHLPRGGIDFPYRGQPGSDVYIRGSVRSGASVEADGTVSVEGSVEAGAVIQAKGDVAVARGIVGHGTRVVAQGDVDARFVQNGSVVARGCLTATYLMNATVHARDIVVRDAGGDDRAGSIVGGQIVAASRVEASRIGSPTSEPTRIAIVADPQVAARLQKLDKGLAFCRTNTLRILRTLGVREIDAVQLRTLIERAQPEKRRPLLRILHQLKQLVDVRDRSVQCQRRLEGQREELLDAAEISVRDLVHADALLQVGDCILKPADDIRGGAVFRRQGATLGWIPYPGAG